MEPTYLNLDKARELTAYNNFELLQIFFTWCEKLEYNTNITTYLIEGASTLKRKNAYRKLTDMNIVKFSDAGCMLNPEYAFVGDWDEYDNVVKRYNSIPVEVPF